MGYTIDGRLIIASRTDLSVMISKRVRPLNRVIDKSPEIERYGIETSRLVRYIESSMPLGSLGSLALADLVLILGYHFDTYRSR
jgi:hypothetical protein